MDETAAIRAHPKFFKQRTMHFANLGLMILFSIFWPTVTCEEYRNYPIQVHQMFQERVHLSSKYNDRVRGNWGSWTAWSDCTRSCGTGIQSQSRECVPMRSFLRKRSIASIEGQVPEVKPFCIGTYRRYHVCNTQECPNFGDLRAEQCAKYNGKFYKGQSYQWEPFPDAPNECALNCRAIGERFYATLEPTVLDGTPCRGTSRGRVKVPGVLAVGTNDRWLCVGGQCKSVGCDGVVGSGRLLDACGICGGEGNNCRLYEGIFLEPKLAKGYQIVTTIPKGAISLNVSELRPSSNSLALRNSNGTFIINGPSSGNQSGIYKNAGTIFSYHRGDAMHAENIFTPDSLTEPVDLMILSEELNPGILYKYVLPLNEKIDESSMLAPPLLVTSPYDRIGNEIPTDASNLAILSKDPKKIEKFDNTKNAVDPKIHEDKWDLKQSNVTQKMAGDQPMKTQSIGKKRKKNKKKKIFIWKISALSPCSKACGGGIQHATFKCFREITQAMAPERRCKNVPRPPSPPPLSCNTRPCPARWRAGPWSPCSVTCGIGTQTRDIECVQEINSKLTMRVASGACIEKSDIKTSTQCKLASCVFTRTPEARQMHPEIQSTSNESRWITGPWGACSSTCGSAIRKRQVTCVTAGAATCSPETKPVNEIACEALPECKNVHGLKAPWLYTEWSSQCSAECGIGFRTRQVACNDGNEVFCDASKKPPLEEGCTGNGTNCDRIRYQWFVGAWSPCTVSCGAGVQRRDVICLASDRGEIKITDDGECGKLTRPLAEERCSRPPCPAEWFTSDWSECTQTCGPGLQTRVVRCLREGVPASGCPESNEPKERRLCKKEVCKTEAQSQPKPPKKVYDKIECSDKYPNCDIVVKVGICKINYYKHLCCNCRD